MNKELRNIELEKQIDRYVKGNLTETEAHKMWVELLKQPEYLPLLQAEIDLARYYRRPSTQKSSYTLYLKWFAAAAAVVLLVISISLFYNNQSLESYTLDEIALADNLATATVMRSDESGISGADSLLNLGFKNAIEGHIDKSMAVYNKVINRYERTQFAAKAHLNVGILQYNSGQFEASVTSFKAALFIPKKDSFLQEQAFWYMGNALINLEEFKKARDAIQQAYNLNGVHKMQALKLLKRLDKKVDE